VCCNADLNRPRPLVHEPINSNLQHVLITAKEYQHNHTTPHLFTFTKYTTASFNPLECRGNYSATSNDMKLVHWPLMGGLLGYIWYCKQGTGQGHRTPRPLLTVPNVTAHPSMASVPITILLYNGPLLCSFNVPIKS